MNADDRGQAGEAKPPISQPAANAPMRREGVMPPSGSVPQRTAFRPVTGVHSTTQGGAGTAPATSARQSSYAPPAQGAGAPAQGQAPQRPAAQGHAAQGQSAQPRESAPASASPAAGSFSPVSSTHSTTTATRAAAPSGAGAATAAGTSSADGVPTRSATGAFGVGRVKTVAADSTTTTGAKPAAKAALPGAPRKVRVLVSRIDPWSALKIGFLLSIAIGIMTVVAAHILWSTLNAMGTFDTIQEWVAKLFGEGQEVNILQFFSYKKDMSAVLLVSVVNVVLLSGLSVITAFIYNMISRVVGGVYLTLTDD